MNELLLNFTSPEQSKRLLELGVPADSADCIINDMCCENFYTYTLEVLGDGEKVKVGKYILPCWSVGRLIEIFLLCTPYKDIALNTSNLVEQMVVSLFMVNKDGLLDFSKLED